MDLKSVTGTTTVVIRVEYEAGTTGVEAAMIMTESLEAVGSVSIQETTTATAAHDIEDVETGTRKILGIFKQ